MSSLLSVHGGVMGHGLLVPLVLPWLGKAWGTQRGWTLALLCWEYGKMWAPALHAIQLQKINPKKNTLLGKPGSLWKRRSSHKLQSAYFSTKTKIAVLVPLWRSARVPLGTVELGWAQPLSWTCPWGFAGATTATAQEDLAHCQHMRDRE